MLRLCKIAVSAVLLGALVLSADWHDIKLKISSAHLGPLLGACVLLVLQFPISAYKWGKSLQIHNLTFPFWFLQKVLCIGFFFNNFLPTSVGGDTYRVVRTLPEEGLRSRAVSAVLLERVLGLGALLAVGFLYAAGTYGRYETRLVDMYLVVGLIGACAVAAGAWVLTRTGLGGRIRDLLSGKKLRFLIENLRLIAQRPLVLLAVGALSVLFQVVAITIVYLLFRAFGVAAPFSSCALIAALSGVAAVLPISINGIGVTEGTFVYTASQLGLEVDPSIMVAFTLRIAGIPLSLACGLLYVFETGTAGRTSPPKGEPAREAAEDPSEQNHAPTG